MSNPFTAMGFTGMDGFILFLCIAASVSGSLADYILRRDDFENLPATEPTKLTANRTVSLFFGRVVFIGAITGATVWLIFNGSMNVSPAAYSKLFLLSGWAGFTAPQTAVRMRNLKVLPGKFSN